MARQSKTTSKPTIKPAKEPAVKSFVISSFVGGISDYDDKGIKGSFKEGSSNLSIRRSTDSLFCNQALVDETLPAGATLINFIVNCSDGNAYGFDDSGHVLKRVSGTWSTAYTDTHGAIQGAAEWYDNAGHTFLYWVCAGGYVHRKLIPGVTTLPWSDVDGAGNGNDPWPKSGLSTTPAWHTMKEAAGDLMICNDNNLAMVGYDNSFTTNAVDLLKGNRAKTLLERGDYVVIGTGKTNGQQLGNIFSWQTQALSWINKEDIPSSGVNAMIDTEVPLLQAGTNGEIFFSDFVNTLSVVSFPGGGQVNPDGVDNDGGYALFGVYGNGAGNSGVYSYGRDSKNAPFVLNLEYQFDCDSIGSVKLVGSDTLISYKNGATYGVKKVDSANKATATCISLDLKAPTKPPSIPTIWTKVKLKTAKLPASCSITLYYRMDKQGSFQQAYMAGDVTTFNITNATEAVFLVQAIGEIFEVKLVLTPNGNNSPEVYKIECFFI